VYQVGEDRPQESVEAWRDKGLDSGAGLRGLANKADAKEEGCWPLNKIAGDF